MGGSNITLWHGRLQEDSDGAGKELFDLPQAPTLIEGFPIEGHVDVKFVKGGVQVPISLKLPGYFGGVTGSATLEATTAHGLKLKLAGVQGRRRQLRRAGAQGRRRQLHARRAKCGRAKESCRFPQAAAPWTQRSSVEFDKGQFTSGSLDVGLPYPGIPLDDNDPPPQLYLSHGGLGLGLNPLTLSGTIGFGVTPLRSRLQGRTRATSRSAWTGS